MTDDALGSLLRSMLGPPDPQPGPPCTHTLRYPEPEVDDDGNPTEPYRPPPPTMTVERGPRGRLHELAPLESSAVFRRLTTEMLTATVGIGCYWPLTDAE
jgi:hypothetical protein